jgi:hypothetical protein
MNWNQLFKLCCLVVREIEIWNQRHNSLELDYN